MFKDRLKEARLAAKLTQNDLAEAIGVAKSTVTGYEKGNSEPDMNKVTLIMQTLQVDANYLWQDEIASIGGFSSALTYEESELLRNYRELDAPGKAAVMAILELQSKRIEEFGPARKRKPIPIIGTAIGDGSIKMKYAARQEIKELAKEPTADLANQEV